MPSAPAQGVGPSTGSPSRYAHRYAHGPSRVFVRIESLATWEMDARASPRKPKLWMDWRSSKVLSLDVAWRTIAVSVAEGACAVYSRQILAGNVAHVLVARANACLARKADRLRAAGSAAPADASPSGNGAAATASAKAVGM